MSHSTFFEGGAGRTLPSVSVPSPNAHMDAATAAALPLLEPPGCSARLCGFRHWPPRPEYPSELKRGLVRNSGVGSSVFRCGFSERFWIWGSVLVGRPHAGPFGHVGVPEEDGACLAEFRDDEGVFGDYGPHEDWRMNVSLYSTGQEVCCPATNLLTRLLSASCRAWRYSKSTRLAPISS